jgi:type III pantothenate kinase
MTLSTETLHLGTDPLADDARLVLDHVGGLGAVLDSLAENADRLAVWGNELAERLQTGSRLLVAGNGGSAAEAQHLTAELVGRFDGDRAAFSAIALNAETSSVTAIGNDYGFDEVFARQVRGHARPGDMVMLLSTSGNSRNLVRAAEAARAAKATTWTITGPAPNRLALVCDDAICLDGPAPHVQEAQLVAIHALCRVFDGRVTQPSVDGRVHAETQGGKS